MCLIWLWHHMLSVSYISQESCFFLLLLCSFMLCSNNRIHYGSTVVFDCLHFTPPHYHHYADVSEGIGLLKYLSGTLCRVCVSTVESFLSITFHAIYGAVHIQLSQFSYDDCENMRTLSHYHNEIDSMIHLPLFRVRSCAICLSIFLQHC